MAEPLRALHPVPEDVSEDHVSAVSPSSSRRIPVSPIKDFSPSAFFGRSGYQMMPDDGQEMVHFGTSDHHFTAGPSSSSSPPTQHLPQDETSSEIGAGGLGISGLPTKDLPAGLSINGSPSNNRNSLRRKPVGSGASPPGASLSHHGLLSLAASTAASTPVLSGFLRGPALLSSPHSRNRGSWDPQSSFAGAQESNTLRSYVGTPATTASTQGTPGQLDPRGEFLEDEFDDEVFYKGFGELMPRDPQCGN